MRPSLIEYTAVLALLDQADPEYHTVHRSILEEDLTPNVEEGGFLALFILRGSDGLMLVSTDEKQERNYRESRPYFVEGKSCTYIQNVYYSPTLGKSAITISTPIKDEEDNPIAVLAGHVDLIGMSEIIMQASGLSQTEQTYLVNKFGFFVTEPWFSDGYDLEKALHTDGVEACLEHNDGFGFYDDYRGVPVIGAYRWMPEWELGILTEVEQAEAFAPIITLRNTVFGIGVAIALIVALLGVFFNRTLTWPLRRLVKGTEEISRGNLEYRASTTAKDEIGQLSRAFDQMVEDLKAVTVSRDELVEEVAEHKRVEGDLRRMAVVVKDSNDAVTVRDFEGRFLAWNRGAECIYGWSEAEALAMNIVDIVPKEKRDEELALMRQLQRGELLESFEMQRVTKDRRTLDVWITVTKLSDDAGLPIAIATTERDITERKRAEEELKQIMAELKRSNAELELFAYVASHDLQEPLRMVSSYTQLLERRYKDRLDADADEFISYAVGGAKRMQDLLNDLLAYSRVGTRGKPLEPTDCAAVFDAAVANLKVAIRNSGAEVTHDALPVVMADEGQLVQLFQNLIDNAIKFRGEELPRVHVSAEQRGNEWVFSVRDNGVGIEPQYFERVFIIFQRLHSGYPGTGTGLSICKRIVERHGGRIWLESQAGKGSTVWFAIPVKGGKQS
ncbi:MAG TPA: PAS domain S-box protein [Dehalococcoidia bacterium]|nr:PAS domain S-box protein [Dehalococcoidia bacterium]